MKNILSRFAEERTIKTAIKASWENYHYCLGYSPNVELSIGRHLTWLMTDLPDHFLNMVVSTQLPIGGADELIEGALARFRSETASTHPGLKIIPVEDEYTLRQWIHVASIGFRIPEKFEQVWQDLFGDAISNPQYRTYLALRDGKPVGTTQLFLSEGVAGIYNVTVLPEARHQGIGSAVTLTPLFEARKLGYRSGILQASKRGYNVYRRLGFQDVGSLSLYLWENELNEN